MIELYPTTALMLYLGLTLTFILSIWIFQHYGVKKKPILPPEQMLHLCEFCHFPYLESATKKITRCPGCNSFNSKEIE